MSRASFLAPNFDPAGFLSSLTDRHQTLEDLRTELRELSVSLNKELVDLVNSNYQDFLSLGTTLDGGEEKVEDVRVGLLGFQRDLEAVRDKVEKRRTEVAALLEEKRKLKREIYLGQRVLNLVDRIGGLEERLMIGEIKPGNRDGDHQRTENNPNIAGDNDDYNDDDDDDLDSIDNDSSGGDDDAQQNSLYLRRIERHINQYLTIKAMVTSLEPMHPFLSQQNGRLEKIRSTLILDLGTASKQTQSSENGVGQQEQLKRMYTKIGEQQSLANSS